MARCCWLVVGSLLTIERGRSENIMQTIPANMPLGALEGTSVGMVCGIKSDRPHSRSRTSQQQPATAASQYAARLLQLGCYNSAATARLLRLGSCSTLLQRAAAGGSVGGPPRDGCCRHDAARLLPVQYLKATPRPGKPVRTGPTKATSASRNTSRNISLAAKGLWLVLLSIRGFSAHSDRQKHFAVSNRGFPAHRD